MQTDNDIRDIIRTAHDEGEVINIVSGEGEQGTVEVYTGKLTVRAIQMRLTRERGTRSERWAQVQTRRNGYVYR